MDAAREREIEARLYLLEKAVVLLSSVPGTPSLPPRPDTTGPPTNPLTAPDADVPHEVLAFIDAGKDVHAVKAYRDATGARTKEAKAVVDRLKRERGR